MIIIYIQEIQDVTFRDNRFFFGFFKLKLIEFVLIEDGQSLKLIFKNLIQLVGRVWFTKSFEFSNDDVASNDDDYDNDDDGAAQISQSPVLRMNLWNEDILIFLIKPNSLVPLFETAKLAPSGMIAETKWLHFICVILWVMMVFAFCITSPINQ